MYGRPPVDRLAKRLRKEGSARILFLSNHGAARALIAESIVNRYSASGFIAIAAGVSPEGEPHPMAQELLRAYRLPSPRTRPLSFEEALDTEARDADFVVALWDRACGEPSPAPYGDALAASWDVPDPRRPYNAGAGIIGSRMGFVRAYQGLRSRIEHFFADVAAEQRATGGPLSDLDDGGMLDVAANDAPEELRIGRDVGSGPPSAKPRRSWSWGGVFGSAGADRAEVSEPLSLGKAQLVREPRRATRA